MWLAFLIFWYCIADPTQNGLFCSIFLAIYNQDRYINIKIQ